MYAIPYVLVYGICYMFAGFLVTAHSFYSSIFMILYETLNAFKLHLCLADILPRCCWEKALLYSLKLLFCCRAELIINMWFVIRWHVDILYSWKPVERSSNLISTCLKLEINVEILVYAWWDGCGWWPYWLTAPIKCPEITQFHIKFTLENNTLWMLWHVLAFPIAARFNTPHQM